ncbi:MAG TPA: hypothetical protein EYG18_11525 [Micavibrio sp.]|nr:hypothetical protein [Micavibrio sp.]HIL29890.1 hypothetical protein [Micavibrio sp.]
MGKEKPCYTYSYALLYGARSSAWDINWDFLECPSHQFIYKKGFPAKKRVSEQATIRIHENFILIETAKGEIALPNDPVVLEVLEDIIKHAKQIQTPFEEEERLENIKLWQREGYLHSRILLGSPIDEYFDKNSMRMELRREHEERRRKKGK